MSAEQKNELVARLAGMLGVDYEQILDRGTLQIMTPDMVRALPADLVDVQLHTHRHRTPRDHALFVREIRDNAQMIRELRGSANPLEQFCYPSGDYAGEFFDWLRECDVRYATTCVPDLASSESDPMLVPRFIDTMLQSDTVFEAWTSGFAALCRARPSISSTRRGSTECRDDFGGRAHSAHRRQDVRHRVCVQHLGARGHGVGDEDLLVAALEGGARRRLDAEVGRDAREDDRLDGATAEMHLEVGAVERIRLMLRDDDVARLTIELRDELTEIGRRVERRAWVVGLRPRKEHTVRTRIDVHEYDKRTSLSKGCGQFGAVRNDVGGGVGNQVAAMRCRAGGR